MGAAPIEVALEAEAPSYAVFNQEERMILAKSCRWVKKVTIAEEESLEESSDPEEERFVRERVFEAALAASGKATLFDVEECSFYLPAEWPSFFVFLFIFFSLLLRVVGNKTPGSTSPYGAYHDAYRAYLWTILCPERIHTVAATLFCRHSVRVRGNGLRARCIRFTLCWRH